MKCSRCYGKGQEWHDEPGRRGGGVWDTCYHCAGSGTVDDETDFQDRLGRVARYMARVIEESVRKARNEDPEGDGYDMGAWENGFTSAREYFECQVSDRSYSIVEKLLERSRSDQEFLIAWNEYRIDQLQFQR